MLGKNVTVALFLTIFGLLVGQRILSLPPQLEVTVSDSDGEAIYEIGTRVPRGTVIQTQEAFLQLWIEPGISLWLAKDTRIELHRLYKDELTIRFTKGRLVIDNHSDIPLRLETNHTAHQIYDAVATFVNYDFLEFIHVIPLSGIVESRLDAQAEGFLVTSPLSIHETDPVTQEPIQVNLQAGDAAEFYQWTGILTQK